MGSCFCSSHYQKHSWYYGTAKAEWDLMAPVEWVQAICLLLGVWVVGTVVAATRSWRARPILRILRSKAAGRLQDSRWERSLDLGEHQLQRQARGAGYSFCSGLNAGSVQPGKSRLGLEKQIDDDASCKLVKDVQYLHGGIHQGKCDFLTTHASRATMTGLQLESLIKHLCVSSFLPHIPNPKSPSCVYGCTGTSAMRTTAPCRVLKGRMLRVLEKEEHLNRGPWPH